MESNYFATESQEIKNSNNDMQSLSEDEDQPSVTAPFGNCAEKIIFVIDSSFRKRISSYQQTSLIKNNWDLIKRAITMYILTKASLNSKHQFGISFLQEEDVVWFQEMTSNTKLLLDCFNNVQCLNDDFDFPSKCSLGSVFKEIFNNKIVKSYKEGIDNYVIRVIFLYGRNCPIMLSRAEMMEYKEITSRLSFFFDVFCMLCDEESISVFKDNITNLSRLDGNNYVVMAFKNPAHVFESIASLLAHPLQRCPQKYCHYALDS
ncbi:uncharacterized protein LOC101236705 isoform X1 [Hydra vulgaris]|uniref:uncharacterized protein LOC101236705 isoform X1 n=1 Tax=Hydra vulgaris TaxID=6087 RepID=UPI001F5ED470|nr:uncharacterized protein LOC101236705 [Hydra vulgaris]